jgi:hypothetical protein
LTDGGGLTNGSWTLEMVDARLKDCRDDGRLRLSGARLDSGEVGALLASLGADELAIVSGPVARAGSTITVAGTTTLFGIEAVVATATFAVDDGALSVALVLELPAAVRIDLPFIGLGLGGLKATLEVSGGLDMPIVSTVLAGVIQLDTLPIPVTVAPGADAWQIEAGPFRLPDAASLGRLLGRPDVAGLIPAGLADVRPGETAGHRPAGGLSVERFVIQFDPRTPSVHAISATLATDPEWSWDVAPPVFSLRNVGLTVGVLWPRPLDDEARRRGDAGRAEPVVIASAGATLKLDRLTVPVLVAYEAGTWRLAVRGATGLPGLGELIGLVSGQRDLAGSLPSGVRTLRLDSASFEVTIAEGSVRSILFDAGLAEHWTIVDDAVEVENARLSLFVDRAHDDVSGSFTGAVRIGEVGVPVAVQKPGRAEPWTLTLGCSGRLPVGGVSSLARVARGGAGTLPDLGSAALSLSDFTLQFDPATRSVTSIHLEAGLEGAWSPPGLDDLDVRDATLTVDVQQPADPHPRVDAAIRVTVDVADVRVPMAARWQTA